MKIVNYKCDKCNKEEEVLYGDTEEPLKELKVKCSCGGKVKIWNFKNNPHRWSFNDRGGI